MFCGDSRITVIAGHYGSGKTEFAVNLAYHENAHCDNVILADLDIVNPYFCSREQEISLKEIGIDVIAPSIQCRLSDVPALPADIAKIFSPNSSRCIIDVGGDGAGAKVLSRYMPQLSACGYDMWMVLNANRPQTATVESALEYIDTIQSASRLKINGIVNNTHLCEATTAAEVIKGSELAKSVCKASGLPFICSTAPKAIEADLSQNDFEEPLFFIDIHMKKPWEL